MTGSEWSTANQHDVAQSLDRVLAALAHHAGVEAPAPSVEAAAIPRNEVAELALASLVRLFGLSSFERDIVLLCAGIELDARFAPVLANAIADGTKRGPTFGLALAFLPDAHWSALAPDAPLRAWRLVELSGTGLTTAALRLDERILHFLAGVAPADERLQGVARVLRADPIGSVRHHDLATNIARHIETVDVALNTTDGRALAVQVTGADAGARLSMAASTCAILGCEGLLMRATEIPATNAERFALARILSREALLSQSVIVIDAPDTADGFRVALFVELLRAPTMVCVQEPLATLGQDAIAFIVPTATRSERLALWHDALGASAAGLNGTLARVSAQFELDSSTIRAIAVPARLRRASASADTDSANTSADALWDACRAATRPRMDGLAQRIEVVAGWNDIVLPEQQQHVLRAIASHVRQRHRVYDDWGFASKSARGLGITALFAGASGTGKTMAAEVLARELRLDLYRIDLASVVSKYIGETEKNLQQLFDAAEGGSAILLFDEADALFGKRSEVKDSHDRYANIEVSYLLQRMESFSGLAILTTNMRNALDPAFVRRIRYMVQFPFPDTAQRAAIWRTTFPAGIETRDFDWDRLAQLNVAGGQIRNIALGSAFIAADRNESITMSHLAQAARAEYAKTERTPSDAEMRGWGKA
ncbi:MAG: AAA family ATPase [Gemmatimonadaceae bacterium]